MIWDFEAGIGGRLLAWAASTLAVALILLTNGGRIGRVVAVELVAWAVVAALVGLATLRRAAIMERITVRSVDARERADLRRILRVASAVGLLALLVGLVLVLVGTPGQQDVAAAGVAAIVQGAFMGLFGEAHATMIPVQSPRPTITGFDGPEHVEFTLPGTRGTAVLVHGFGATPDEVRPLAEALRASGWTAVAPLLPGFGPDLSRLPETRFEHWLAEVERVTADAVATTGRPLLLAGHSMGGALALAAAPTLRPDSLVLFAPYWLDESRWRRLGSAFLGIVRPSGIRPFRSMDLGDPHVRADVSAFLGGLDLEDPATVAMLRELAIPVGFVRSIGRGTRAAIAGATGVPGRVLVVQGTGDDLVPPDRTRRLVAAFGRPVELREIDADHAILDPSGVAWAAVREVVLDHAAGLLSETGAGGAGADDVRPGSRRAVSSARIEEAIGRSDR